MSTTFQVYPGKTDIPSFATLLEAANRNLAAALRRHGIDAQVDLQVELRQCQPDAPIPTPLDTPASWSDAYYARFFVPAVAGGTDIDFRHMGDFDREVWEESLRLDANVTARRDLVEPHLRTGHYWSFWRSAGQPGIINLAYGMVAAALADLTDGFIHSYDMAWEFTRFPATANEFLSWYFVPDATEDAEFRSWAEQCLRAIPMELAGNLEITQQEDPGEK